MRNIILLVFFVFSFVSCKKEVKENRQITSEKNTENQIRQSFNGTLNGENSEELLLLQKIIANNLIVTNNHFEFAMSRDTFILSGLSDSYYDKLMESINSANNMIDSTNLQNVNEILEESYQDLYKIFGRPKQDN